MYFDTRKSKPRDRYHHFLRLCSLESYFLTNPFTEGAVNIWLNGDVSLYIEQTRAYTSFVPLYSR